MQMQMQMQMQFRTVALFAESGKRKAAVLYYSHDDIEC